MSMSVTESKAILSALTPEVLAERQRIVDAAVRAARGSSYCDTFNEMLSRVMPEMCVWLNSGYTVAFDSEGVDCGGRTIERRLRDQRRTFNGDGYDGSGYDRDGFDATGYGRDGYDAEGRTKAYWRDRRPYAYNRETSEYEISEEALTRWGTYDHEQVYLTGYGRYTCLDAEGNRRIGRPATPEEAESESESAALFNPTTWTPETVAVG